ncbi:MAG: PAS domain S-box protein [Desulfosalsimonadaceae bacterium]|nr:MAG: PAS domain-containing protein [Desulfobacteraceae bacterium]
MNPSQKKPFGTAHASDKLLRILAFAFDQIDTMAGVIDKDGTMLFANRSALKAAGQTLKQVIGRSFRDSPWRNHSLEAKRLTDRMIEKACNGEIPIIEDSLKGPDGRVIQAIFSITPIRDENGEIIALVPEGKIISDIKMLQARLENERWEMQQWIDSMGSFVAKCTPDGKVVSCNQPFLSSFQLNLESIQGKYICDLTRLKRFKNHQEKLRRVLFDARAGIKGSVEINFSFEQNDDRPSLFNASPIRDSSGRISFVALEITDISEQVQLREFTLKREKEYTKRLEEEVSKIKKRLETTEQFYKNLIDANPTGVLFLNHNGYVIFANPKMEQYFEKVGITKDHVVGKSLSSLHMYPADQFWRKDLTQSENEAVFGQKRMILSNNSNAVYCLEVLLGPIKIPGSDAMGQVVVVNDVTERIKLESDLLSARILAEKMNSLGLFVSGVAHEMNNPLTSILGCAEHLIEDQANDSEAYGALKIIIEGAGRASQIVRNLLRFAYPQSSNHTSICLNDIIKYIVNLYKDQVYKKNIRIILDLCEEINSIIGDTTQIQQVVVNFLQNAVDAIEESGIGDQIIFRTMNQDEWVVMEIEDNGPGIPEENQPNLFDPFFTTKSPGKGTGLGLSINYNVIQRCNGFISLAQDVPSGTRFIIKIHSAKVHEASTKKKNELNSIACLPSKVLIVDDEKILCRNLAKYLKELGCQADTALNGLLAMEILKKKTYDLIMLDLKMPVMGGVELYQYLVEKRPELVKKVIFMSGYSDFEIQTTSVFPRIPVLQKPFSPKELLRLLSNIYESPLPQ